MAASIANSNQTPDSITVALLIHEVGLSHHRRPPRPSLRGLCFHMPFRLIPSDLPAALAPISSPRSAVISKAEEHGFICECLTSELGPPPPLPPVCFYNSAGTR